MRALAVALGLWAGLAVAEGRSLALVVGENRGLVSEETLRFAERDAARFRATLIDVGEHAPEDVELVQGTTAAQLTDTLARLQRRLEQAPVERLTIFVSAHAGDGALHLAGTQLPLSTLVDFLKRAPVQVGLLIVDACQSGRVTRTKGLRPAGPPTRLEATGLEGRVLISASGADEYAQESDALGGSYFTHYFLTGLRGAADTTRDGKVTLEEAYGWAWARTVEATFSSRAGVQRPAFSVELRGQGQLVLSTPARATSQLVLDERQPGHWLLVNEATAQLAADVEKGEGPLRLAVPEGAYRLQLRTADGVYEQRVQVPAKGEVRLTAASLERSALIKVARKGGEEARVFVSAGAGLSSGLVGGLSSQPTLQLRARRDAHAFAFINQLHLGLTGRQGQPVSGSFEQLELELQAGLGHRFIAESLSLAVGVELGGLLVHQARLPDDSTRWSLGLTADLGAELRLSIAGPVETFLLGTGGGALIKKRQGPVLVPRLAAVLGLGVSF